MWWRCRRTVVVNCWTRTMNPLCIISCFRHHSSAPILFTWNVIFFPYSRTQVCLWFTMNWSLNVWHEIAQSLLIHNTICWYESCFRKLYAQYMAANLKMSNWTRPLSQCICCCNSIAYRMTSAKVIQFEFRKIYFYDQNLKSYIYVHVGINFI